MKKFSGSVFLVILALGVMSAGNGFALDLGAQMTVADGQSQWNPYGVYNGTWAGWTGGEDQSVQTYNLPGQQWDLEGIFLKGSALTIVGGFDMKNGQPDAGYPTVYSGDIFLSTTSTMKYGTDVTGLSPKGHVWGMNSSVDGFKTLDNVWGYDYVIHFDSAALNSTIGNTYSVYKLDQNAKLSSAYYRQNDASGAYRYVSGGELIGSGYQYGYQSNLTDAQTGFLGGSHNALTIDLGFLTASTNLTVQYTMGCGNDDIIGKGAFVKPFDPVATPEPGTLLLVGGGLLGFFAIARKRAA